MKSKIAIVILVIACVGLGIGLFVTKQQGDDQHKNDVASTEDFSNQVVEANGQLKDLREVNLSLTNDVALSRTEVEQISNSLVSAQATVTAVKTSLAGARDQVTNLNVQVSGLTTQISGLESQNEVLDQRIQELTNTISHLDVEIANTKSELALTQTNNAYLQNELQAQMAQRADLEHKFNDLSEVKAQVSKLKNELFIARRVELQNENSGKKGGEMLMTRTAPTTNGPAKSPARYDLNVEIGSDGSVRVIPPLGATNSAAH